MTDNDIIETFKLKNKSSYKLFIEKAEEMKVFKACGNLDDMWVMCRFKCKEHKNQFIFSLSI